jgi:hypothetical protein
MAVQHRYKSLETLDPLSDDPQVRPMRIAAVSLARANVGRVPRPALL